MLSKYTEDGTGDDASAAAALETPPDDAQEPTPDEAEIPTGFDVPEGFPGEVGETVSVKIVEGPDGQRQFEPVTSEPKSSWKDDLKKEMA